jgi:hypothetical protein
MPDKRRKPMKKGLRRYQFLPIIEDEGYKTRLIVYTKKIPLEELEG